MKIPEKNAASNPMIYLFHRLRCKKKMQILAKTDNVKKCKKKTQVAFSPTHCIGHIGAWLHGNKHKSAQ